MAAYKVISADSHIVEPPDMYTSRIEPKFRERAPRIERHKTPAGREYDAWMLDGTQVGNGSHIRGRQVYDDSLRDEAMSHLQGLGINTALFVWPAASNVEPFRRRERPVAAA